MHTSCFYRASIAGALLFLFPIIRSIAQIGNTMPKLGSVIPLSPNAAALAKYGEVPVGYYTGIPSINVPLYEINTGSLQLPLSLGYHAGGVKVEEVASPVGLSWTLNAGGVISRQIRGIADENNGYLTGYAKISQYLSGMSSSDKLAYFKDLEDNLADSQQDLFFYNFNGGAGKFVFDSTGQVLTMPATRNKFEFGTFLGQPQTWKLTDVNGIQYYFTLKELTDVIPVNNGVISSSQPTSNITSWYMTKIVNALGTDTIDLNYTFSNTQNTSAITQTKYIYNGGTGPAPSKQPDNSYAITSTVEYQLSKIKFRNGSVLFKKNSQQRCDYPSNTSLDTIEIRSDDESMNKFFYLYHSYLTTNSSACDLAHPENSRLFLDSMVFEDRNGAGKGVYSFSYNTSIRMPSRLSFNQDHWGYYNGASNGTNFVPTTTVNIQGTLTPINGADRNPNAAYTQAGMLKSITYPTGGKTSFEYENNTAANLQINQGILVTHKGFSVYYSAQDPLLRNIPFSITDDNGSGGVNASISINNGGGACANSAAIGCPLVGFTGPVNSGNILHNTTTFLPKGNYQLRVDLRTVSDTNILHNFNFSLNYDVTAQNIDSLQHNILVGGLRIKKITDYTTDNQPYNIRQYQYLQPDSIHYSSGYLLSFPQYMSTMTILSGTGSKPMINEYQADYITLSSGSNYPLASTQSAYVGYKFVRELLGENGESGKNEYTYRAPNLIQDVVQANFPFAPATSRDWQRGQLTSEKNYRYNPGTQQYVLVQEKSNDYNLLFTHIYQGIKVGKNRFVDINYVQDPNPLNNYVAAQFSTELGWSSLSKSTIKLYDQLAPDAFTQSTTNYTYDTGYYLPVSITTTNSKGETVVTGMKYPLDYKGLSAADGFTKGIALLQNRNIVAPVIEKYTMLQPVAGTSAGVLNATITTYKADAPLPDTIFSTEFSVPSLAFVPSSVNNGSIGKSSLYTPQLYFSRYDAMGNVREKHLKLGEKHVYLWNYQLNYPVAEATNADSADVAYSSFETEDNGNWIVNGSAVQGGITGVRAYNGNLTKSISASKNYLVTLWSSAPASVMVNGSAGTVLQTNGAWSLLQWRITGTSMVQVSGNQLDEVRLLPAGALMHTYTYQSLTGMSGECDERNRITYYQYDLSGRLKCIQDQDHHIVKQFSYQYGTGVSP